MNVRSATRSGDGANADRIIVGPHLVIVLDGASSFEPTDVDPGTYADALGASIANHLYRLPDATVTKAVADGIDETRAKLHLSPGASPSSTVSVLRTRGDVVDLYVLGDSPMYFSTSDGQSHRLIDDRLERLPIPERAQYRRALRDGTGYGPELRRTLAALQRAQRAVRNTHCGYWIAETNPDAARHGITVTVPAGDVSWAVLATDGAADIINYLGAPKWSEISKYDNSALNDLLACLHRWEAIDDPNGIRLPRAKRHDDKTLVAVSELL